MHACHLLCMHECTSVCVCSLSTAAFVANPLTNPVAPGAPRRHRDDPQPVEMRYQVNICICTGCTLRSQSLIDSRSQALLHGGHQYSSRHNDVAWWLCRCRPCPTPCHQACTAQPPHTSVTSERMVLTPWSAAHPVRGSKRAAAPAETSLRARQGTQTTRLDTQAISLPTSESAGLRDREVNLQHALTNARLQRKNGVGELLLGTSCPCVCVYKVDDCSAVCVCIFAGTMRWLRLSLLRLMSVLTVRLTHCSTL